MNAHDSALAFGRAIRASTAPALAPVFIYVHDCEILRYTAERAGEIQLPAVLVRVRFEALCGSPTVGKAKVEIDIESQSDDDTSAIHSAREAAVRAVLADLPALTAAFSSTGTVQLLGRPALIENDPDVEARAFKTPLTYRAGIRAL